MKRALLVIDPQKIYSLEDSAYYVEDYQNVIENINSLISKFLASDELVIYIKHEHNPDGSDAGRMFDFLGEQEEIEFKENSVEAEFIDELKLIDNAPIVIKRRYDSFIGTNLEEILVKNGIERVVVCGFMTNFCCESTTRHAHDLDFYADFVVDAMGTPGTESLSPEETTNATIATIESGFAAIVKTEEV